LHFIFFISITKHSNTTGAITIQASYDFISSLPHFTRPSSPIIVPIDIG
jgi:hypothetical protein